MVMAPIVRASGAEAGPVEGAAIAPRHHAGSDLPAVASTALAGVLAAKPRPARLLGASAPAVYLEVDGTEGAPAAVVAIVAAGAVLLPLALAPGGPLPRVGDASTFSVGGGVVTLGSVRVRPVRWFDPRPRLGRAVDALLLAQARRALQDLPSGWFGLPACTAEDVAAGLRAGDPTAAVRLIGWGPGLTPAGDDVVAGVLAVQALLGRPDPSAVCAILAHATAATTSLSAALLRCAAAGEVVPEAAALLQAITGHGALSRAQSSLCAVGSTSGAALARGLIAGAWVLQSPERCPTHMTSTKEDSE